MTHKRQLIRERWKTLLEGATTGTQVESNRTYPVSAWPLLNIVTGADQGMIEDYSNESKPRVLDLMVEIHVSGDNHDDQIDDYLEIIDNLIAANPRTADWSACQFAAADEPEDEGGEKPYSKCVVHIFINFEV